MAETRCLSVPTLAPKTPWVPTPILLSDITRLGYIPDALKKKVSYFLLKEIW